MLIFFIIIYAIQYKIVLIILNFSLFLTFYTYYVLMLDAIFVKLKILYLSISQENKEKPNGKVKHFPFKTVY